MTLTIPADKKFNVSATTVAWDRANNSIYFGRQINSTVEHMTMACTEEQFVAKLEKTRRLSDSDFTWMASL